jgi:hypothetical protein
VEAIAMGLDGGVLDLIEMAADFFGSVNTVIEVRDEARDSAFEVDVIFPEGVVSVDEQGLSTAGAERLRLDRLGLDGLGSSGHVPII